MKTQLVKSITRPVLAVVLAAGLMLTVVSSMRATPTDAATGGVDVNRYCTTNFPPYLYGRSFASISGGWNAWGWRCHVGWTNIDIYGVDMNLACRQQYRPWAYARTLNPSSPFSWQCVY